MSGGLNSAELASLRTDAKNVSRYRVVPFFQTWRDARRDPIKRRFVVWWLLVSALVIPTGSLTRLFEWTGVPVPIGGETAFVTVYLPMVICVVGALWFGFVWAAIPAYLSSFAVAAIGGMPWQWNLVFALSNPVALGVLALAYRSVPVSRAMRSSQSLLFFVLISFVASLAGSLGAFVWAHTNDVGLHEFFPVWQGWWLGGFLQSVLLCAPILALATHKVSLILTKQGLSKLVAAPVRRRHLLIPTLLLLSTPLIFLLINLRFSEASLERLLARDPALAASEGQLRNLLDGMALPLWCLIGFVALTLLFGYRLGLVWEERYRSMAKDLSSANAELARIALRDPLTGLFNRTFFLESMSREISAAIRHGRPTSCLLIDVDHFKAINDEHGHLVGDDVLLGLARVLRLRLRQSDILARFGGDEFIALLPSTGSDAASRLAEELRGAFESERFGPADDEISLTVSIGVSCMKVGDSSMTPTQLIDAADRALYQAKRFGRNEVALASPERARTRS